MKSALILGATGGIGKSIAKTLAKKGWSLYLQYNSHENIVNNLIDNFSKSYPQQDFISIKADFNDLNNIDKIVANIFTLDAIVAAQGVTKYQLFSDISAADFQKIFQVNVEFPLLLIRKLQEKLVQSTHGRIVLLGSVYGKVGSPMEVTYSTSKGALISFANAYAKEVASLGITVNVIAPGAVATPMNNIFSNQEKNEIIDEIPEGRFADPRDVTYWVLNLLDEKAQYLTGQTLYVTGGWLN